MGCGGSKPPRNALAEGTSSSLFVRSIQEKQREKDSVAGKTFDEVYRIGKLFRSFGKVAIREGTYIQTTERVCVKMIMKQNLSKFDQDALEDEICVLKQLDHPTIVRLYDVFDEMDFCYLIMERLSGGELFDRIVEKACYTEQEAQQVGYALMDALRYCHEQKVAHRDIKPENIYLADEEDDLRLKIADFSFATRCEEPKSLTTQCGTPGYVAPEILEGIPYDTQADMWSLGVTLYIVLGGYPPFSSSTNNQRELFHQIRRGDYTFHHDYWSHVSQDAKDVISSLLIVNPDQRSTAATLLQSTWMTTRSSDTSTTAATAATTKTTYSTNTTNTTNTMNTTTNTTPTTITRRKTTNATSNSSNSNSNNHFLRERRSLSAVATNNNNVDGDNNNLSLIEEDEQEEKVKHLHFLRQSEVVHAAAAAAAAEFMSLPPHVLAIYPHQGLKRTSLGPDFKMYL